jgi:hypothetical protein
MSLAGCAVTLLSKYDQGTDQMTGALQRNMAIHVETLAGQKPPHCFHKNHRDFYTQQHADVGALEMRVSAIPKNSPTITQVDDLKKALNTFESLHRSASASGRCQTSVELQPSMDGLNAIFRAILKLEIAKQRGDDLAS